MSAEKSPWFFSVFGNGFVIMHRELNFKICTDISPAGRDFSSWLERVVKNISETSSFDVFEFYRTNPKEKPELFFYCGDESLYSKEGLMLPIALQVFRTGTKYVFPHSDLVSDPFAVDRTLAHLPRWKLILPVIHGSECLGVMAIASNQPFRKEDEFAAQLTEWTKQTAVLSKNLLIEENILIAGSGLHIAFDAISEWVFQVNKKYEVVFCNNAFSQFLSALVGKSLNKIIPNLHLLFGNQFSEFLNTIQRALNGRRQEQIFSFLISGEEKKYHITFTPVAASAGEMNCLCLATEISQNEKQNIKPEALLKENTSLIHLIPDIVWVIDERGTIKFVNSTFEKITGFTAKEIIGRSSFEFFSKDELPNHLQQMLLYLSGSKKSADEYFEFRFIDKKGKSITLESVAINLLEHEDIKGIVVSARNISRQAAERRELEDKEELYHSLFESLSEAILITDKNHYLVYCNSLLSKLTGYTLNELGSMPLYQLIIAEEYWKTVERGINNRFDGKSEQYEVEVVRKNGTKFWALISAAPYRSKTGEIVGSVGTLTDITHRKKDEEEMRWLAKFPEENPAPIIRISEEGKIIYYNSPANSIVSHISSSGKLNTEWQLIVNKQLNASTPGKIDIEVDGKYFNLTLTSLINNEYINIYGIDVTERFIFQKQLLESEQRLQFLMNSTTEGIIVHENGIIIDLNQAFAGMIGFDEENILGKSVSSFAPENRKDEIQEILRRDIAMQQETMLLNKAGESLSVEITGRSHFYRGKKVKVIAIRDITLRKNAEQKLKENEERLNYFFTLTLEGIALIDEKKIIDVNSAFLQITEFISEEILNKDISEIPLQSLKEPLLSIANSNEAKRIEVKVQLRSGKEIFVLIQSKSHEYRGKNIRVVVMRDITQRKKDEEEILKSKRSAEEAQKAEEQFLAHMSHEIRTPMNGIIGLTDILLKQEHNKEQEEYLRLIKHSADNLLVIVNDILDLSKIRSGKLQFENISLSIREIMNTIFMSTKSKAAEKNLSFDYQVDKKIPEHLLGDPVRFNQILLNLLSNALKFTENGKVFFSAELQSNEKNRVVLQFMVEDSGIGIHEKDLAKIFESYCQATADTTRRFGGTGLGLPIVKQLVELQGGELWVKSKRGEGSRFYFTLPFAVEEEVAIRKDEKISSIKKSESAKRVVEKNGINILLVDDNFINRLLVVHLLEEKGYSVIEAENGYQAIDKLKEEDIDLVLMDISMPDLDGLEATRIIRKLDEAHLRKIPIISMTAHAFKEQIQQAMDAGMDDYLSKPFKPEELYEKIMAQLNPSVEIEAPKPQAVTMEKQSGNMKEKYYDLSFLRQYYDNEEEFINSILALYVKETPGSIKQIEDALNKKDWEQFKSLTHKIKTNIMMMGIKKAEQFLHDTAKIDLKNVDDQKAKSDFREFKKYSLTAIDQIAIDCL